MPYLKFSRDKRGYEHFAIVEPGAPRRGKPSRPRVLFMFRTPPRVKVGRLPFTDEVRRALEEQNPGVRFDWPRLLATPIPPPDAEHWRERRRAEKAAKQAAREAEAADREAPEQGTGEPAATAPDDSLDAEGAAASEGEDHAAAAAGPAETAPAPSDPEARNPGASAAEGAQPGGGRRRNRRRRRRRPNASGPAAAPAAADPGPPSEEV